MTREQAERKQQRALQLPRKIKLEAENQARLLGISFNEYIEQLIIKDTAWINKFIELDKETKYD